MNYKKVLVTGGAGFVGSNLALKLKEKFADLEVLALDNLMRRGSELNLPRLKKGGVKFVHGDVRNKEDLSGIEADLLIECSAEPSVMAGVTSSPEYLINTNLGGAINCFELARRCGSAVIFISTSRVYPTAYLNRLKTTEGETRFILEKDQEFAGASEKGIAESFPLDAPRSLYGTTKLAAELLLQEYINNYGLKGVVDRCGLLTGPWQMGKVDQGVIVLWLAAHFFQKDLKYIGFGGEGKQVRDVLHVDDLFDLLLWQMDNLGKVNGQVYNVGGGLENSVSLCELTRLSEELTGNKINITSVPENRFGDIKTYITDYSKIKKIAGWTPKKDVPETLNDIFKWLSSNREQLGSTLFPN